jgi:CRISPR-associated endonuclease/helicase Cas3
MASGLYSHPAVLLEEHTNRVLELTRRLRAEGAFPYWNESIHSALLELAVALHDFGKTTSYFQDALNGKRCRDAYSRHAHLSALFFLYRALTWGLDQGLELPWEALLFMYLAVKRHHTHLLSVYDELRFPQSQELKILEVQIHSISPEAANTFLQALDLPSNLKGSLDFNPEAFLRWLREKAGVTFRRWRRCWRQWVREQQDSRALFQFLYGFSLLLDADKLEAGVKAHLPERKVIPAQVVEQYKRRAFMGKLESKQKQELNALREQAYQEVLSQPLSPGEHLYTLTLPTGMGKTLTGLAAALTLREVVARARGHPPRIIYALPFLSIIDQNAQCLEDVLQTTSGQVDNRTLVKHHHLADVQYREHRDDERESLHEWDYAVSRLLTEGWHSEIVITTFVQLFDTLLAWRNAAARRVNKLAGAILLLDEVQALPSVYWPLVRRLLVQAAETLNVYVILMTATQPYLLPQARELVPNPDSYFRALNRLDVLLDLRDVSLEEFVAGFRPEKGKSYLFMANTISSAQQLYELLQEHLEEPIAFLSTGVVPRERLKRIAALRKGKYRFAVSTQLIEAGVDVDFDVIYRDMAPLDALVQAAGRCNRHLSPGKRGEFHVVSWVDERGRRYAPRIYDPVLLHYTYTLLEHHERLTEPELFALLSTYFQDVWEHGIPDQVAESLWQAVQELRFDGERDRLCVRRVDEAQGAYISQFCLIEEQPYRRDVFVQLNDDAVGVWKKAKVLIERLRRTRDRWKAQEEFSRLKPQFAQYVISVALRENIPHWDDDLGIYVIHKETLEHFYHSETGFRQQGDPCFFG